MKAIADTGFVVAFGNRSDHHHNWAVDLAATVTPPLLTCEAVLAEASFHLQSSTYVLSLVTDGLLQVAFDVPKNLNRLGELAKRYKEREPGFADLCIIRMSEMYPRHAVVTVDEKNFRFYRRNRREAIPLLCPPKH